MSSIQEHCEYSRYFKVYVLALYRESSNRLFTTFSLSFCVTHLSFILWSLSIFYMEQIIL